ncbi:MAG: hypothetical protein IPP91_08665 [Betaproteobacteria bacterium]|nr:hypothetical protein [Betaproteobacteria bacterium]
MTSKSAYAVIAAIALTLAACGKKEEPPKAPPAPPPPVATPAPPAAPAGVAVSAVMVGKAIGADKKVSAAMDAFAKGDTLYASVDTTGTGSAKLDAKWTYHKGDKVAVVKEDTMTIATTGPATNEFHVSKPDGWPAGDYEVAITLDGKPAGTKKFVVK